MRPPQIRAGDSVTWRVSLPDYPVEAGWQLHYALRGPQGIDLEALAGSAGGYQVEIAGEDGDPVVDPALPLPGTAGGKATQASGE